jgi:hypothetical protein
MNKYQKALDSCNYVCGLDINVLKKQEFAILQKLVDKATSKKVDKYRRHIKLEPTYFCPICENIVEKEHKYCPECGQRLEW